MSVKSVKHWVGVPIIATGVILVLSQAKHYHPGVVVYRKDGVPTAFHRSDPYGDLIPLLNARQLKYLRQGNTNAVISHLEADLDAAILDAKRRRPLLNKDARERVDMLFREAAAYRTMFPRQTHTNLDQRYEKYLQELEQIDGFLKTFAVTNR